MTGESESAGANLAAFLFTIPWLGYRKLYGPAIAISGISVLNTLLIGILFPRIGVPLQVSAILNLVIGMGIPIVSCLRANRWYFRHTQRILAESRREGLSEEKHLALLSRRGGTSVLSLFGVFFGFFVVQVIPYILIEALNAAG